MWVQSIWQKTMMWTTQRWKAELLLLSPLITLQMNGGGNQHPLEQTEATRVNSGDICIKCRFVPALASPPLSTWAPDVLVPRPSLSVTLPSPTPRPHLRSTPFHLDFHFAVTNEVTQARFSRGNRRTEPYKDASASRMEVNDCERKSLRRSAGRGWRRGGVRLFPCKWQQRGGVARQSIRCIIAL